MASPPILSGSGARSTNDGTKDDAVRLIDLNDDGDLDVLTREEDNNLGVIFGTRIPLDDRIDAEAPVDRDQQRRLS